MLYAVIYEYILMPHEESVGTSGSWASGPHPQFALGCASRSLLQRMSQSVPSESSDMTNMSPGALSAMQGQRKYYIRCESRHFLHPDVVGKTDHDDHACICLLLGAIP